MPKLLAKASGGVFIVSLIALSGMMEWRSGHVQWAVVIAIATFASALFAVRAFFPLRAEARRWFIRNELRRRHYRIRALGTAVNELIDSMARLSPGDLSLYHTILRKTEEDDTACIQTSQGSPNHHALVQMTDLKLATPQEFRTLGSPPHTFTTVRYALTPFGRSYIPKLLPDILKRRAS
jgi:hypothetical protein